MLKTEQRILDELSRYRAINKYIVEQDALAAPPPDPMAPTEDPTGMGAPLPGGDVPPMPEAETAPIEPVSTAPVDIENDPDVEKIDDGGTGDESGTEELEITDLVDAQRGIGEKQDSYFEQLFAQLNNLETKLSEMDTLVDKINSLEAKVEKYRPRTPQEKLELRSLDSGPYNQKLSDFFMDKEIDMEKSGKNEYILTSDEAEDFSPSEIRNTFNMPDKTNFGI